MPHSLQVDIQNRQKDVPFVIDRGSVCPALELVLLSEERQVDALSLSFVSEDRIRKIHEEYFHDASSTDCITFPLDADFSVKLPFRYLGEVVVCPKTAFLYVDRCIVAFWKELTLYVVHGLLHLLGYEDTSPETRVVMKQKEKKYMALLAKKGLLLSGSFRSSNTSTTH